MTIKVIVADDHAIIREGIKTVIARKAKDIVVIGDAANGKEVLALAKKTPADVYILDVAMPLLNGIEAAHRLMKQDPLCKTIMLSMHDDSAFVEKALRCGAKGYVLKEDASEVVISAIREVMQGRYFLSPNISEFVVQGFLDSLKACGPRKQEPKLSSREKEVLQLIAEGFSSKEIAVQLDISVNTVLTHRKKIMQKLGMHGQAELIRYALKEIIPTL
ncbi:response regulator [Thermodesulfobacteriota bacterium]